MDVVMEPALVKTLTKHGNSLALVIEKPILEMLGIGPDTLLQVTTDGKSIIVSRADVSRQEKFRAAVQDTLDKYPNMLKRLAQ